MARILEGKRIAILVENGFEQVELAEPRTALEQAGAKTTIVSPVEGKVRAWKFTDWGDHFDVDLALDSAQADDFDALLLPGGVINPDKLRIQPKAVAFVRAFFNARKSIAAICHGPWTLIEVGAPRGRRMTSWPSLETDLTNAGATWVDEEVVNDHGIVTSRKPDDIPAFSRTMIEEFARGAGEEERAA